MAHKTYMFTAPDAHSAYIIVGSYKLTLPKAFIPSRYSTTPQHPPKTYCP